MEKCTFILFSVLLACIIIIKCSASPTVSKSFGEHAIYTIAEYCRTPKTTDEDIESIIKESIDMSYEAKCTMACILKRYGVMSENGSFDVIETKHFYASFVYDSNKLNTIYSAIEKCKDLKEANVCERAFELRACVIQANQALGV